MTTRFRINVIAECRELRCKLRECPPFLFIIMGGATIVSMIATYLIASRYAEEPQIAALMVLIVAALFLVIGNLIINGFDEIAGANRMKSEFITIVSHQLRSPLSILKWTVDVLERHTKDLSGKNENTDNGALFKNFVQTFRETTERMIQLVNSLLEVSRIEARTLILKKEKFSIADVTKKLFENFSNYSAASHVALTFTADPDLPPIAADRERITMVIENLIDNAIRYTTGGTIPIAIARRGNSLIWSITDQGIGIPKSQQKNIFKKFFRADNVEKKQTTGSGIGLYTAHAIIKASSGKIGFTSEERRGSTFWFTLPIA